MKYVVFRVLFPFDFLIDCVASYLPKLEIFSRQCDVLIIGSDAPDITFLGLLYEMLRSARVKDSKATWKAPSYTLI